MRTKTLLILPLLILFTAGTALSGNPTAGKEAPKIPGITKVDPGTKIKDIKSDPFKIIDVAIEGGVMKIKVSYSGGRAQHDFKLYWNGITTRSNPPKTHVYLKHDANGDRAEALIMKTLEFDLAQMNKPIIITVNNDHGDKATVKYGNP